MYSPLQFLHSLLAALLKPRATAMRLYCLLMPVFIKTNGNRACINRLNSWEAITYTPLNILTIFCLGKNRFVLPAVPAGKVYQTTKVGLRHPPGTVIYLPAINMAGVKCRQMVFLI